MRLASAAARSKMDLGNGVCNLKCNTSICKYDGSDCLSEKNDKRK